MKNPDNKPLRIKRKRLGPPPQDYGQVLALLAVAQSNLVKAGKDSAMPHLIAIIKELEDLYGFVFEIMEEKDGA